MLTLVQGWGNKAVGTETQDERKDGFWLSPEYPKQQLHEGSEQMEAYTLKKRKRDCSVDGVCQGGSGHLPTR